VGGRSRGGGAESAAAHAEESGGTARGEDFDDDIPF
jgi:hypothetical protein